MHRTQKLIINVVADVLVPLPLKTESWHDAKFIIINGIADCRYDTLKFHQCWQKKTKTLASRQLSVSCLWNFLQIIWPKLFHCVYHLVYSIPSHPAVYSGRHIPWDVTICHKPAGYQAQICPHWLMPGYIGNGLRGHPTSHITDDFSFEMKTPFVIIWRMLCQIQDHDVVTLQGITWRLLIMFRDRSCLPYVSIGLLNVLIRIGYNHHDDSWPTYISYLPKSWCCCSCSCCCCCGLLWFSFLVFTQIPYI